MKEWEKKMLELSLKLREYEEQYRKKIYPKLTEEQKRKRNYRLINGKEYCDNMRPALNKKFSREAVEILGLVVKEAHKK